MSKLLIWKLVYHILIIFSINTIIFRVNFNNLPNKYGNSIDIIILDKGLYLRTLKIKYKGGYS